MRVIVHPGQAVARQAFGTQPYIELRYDMDSKSFTGLRLLLFAVYRLASCLYGIAVVLMQVRLVASSLSKCHDTTNRDSATDAIIYQDYKIKCDHSLGTASVLGDAYVKVLHLPQNLLTFERIC